MDPSYSATYPFRFTHRDSLLLISFGPTIFLSSVYRAFRSSASHILVKFQHRTARNGPHLILTSDTYILWLVI